MTRTDARLGRGSSLATSRAALARGWREADSAITRSILVAICALLVLSFVQLALTVALAPAYVDWFLRDHGWATADQAPPGEVPGIYVGIGLRCLFSLFWVFSFGRLVEYVVARNRWSTRVVVGYGLIAAVGYGYWVLAGGPWWLTAPRVAQTVCGLVLVVACLWPATRRWLSAHEQSTTAPGLTDTAERGPDDRR